MDFQRFLAELKRRHVYRVAVTYAIALFAAWLPADARGRQENQHE